MAVRHQEPPSNPIILPPCGHIFVLVALCEWVKSYFISRCATTDRTTYEALENDAKRDDAIENDAEGDEAKMLALIL